VKNNLKELKIMRTVIHIIFIALLALVTFFGIGPVLLADGTMNERLVTLLVVILVYIFIIAVYRGVLKRVK
jgi:predicted neutral ceramidase superfamily lipid hydrolase